MLKPLEIIPQKTIGVKSPQSSTQFTQNSAILYAISIGFSQNPSKIQDLKYTYEMNQNFTVFPLMASILNKFDLVSPFSSNPYFPDFNPFFVLQGEHRLQMIHSKIYPHKQYVHKQQIVDVIDKGRYAICIVRIKSFMKAKENQQQLAFINYMSIIIRGMGGFGYKGNKVMKQLPLKPIRIPDMILHSQSYSNQALIYRLANDINPLHVDPIIAALQNYQKPILHGIYCIKAGMASFGNVCRVIIEQILENMPQRIKNYQSRFVGHVFPGQKYLIRLWKQLNLLIFQVQVQQRHTKCIIGSLELIQQCKL